MTGTHAPPIFICIQQMTVVDCQSQTCCSIVFVRMGFVCYNTDSRNEYNSAETGLYYLNSRYYNPEIGRFMSADALLDVGCVQGASYKSQILLKRLSGLKFQHLLQVNNGSAPLFCSKSRW